VRLVLDNADELAEPAALYGLERLLRNQPPRLRLVLAFRRDPPLPLCRLRVAGRLSELRADALRFTAEEAKRLLAQHATVLDADELALLVDRTEGWPAGLRLAAMALRGAPDAGAVISGFTGDDRAVADYLVGEVLSRQTAEARAFLESTSVCETLCGDLAAALTGTDGAAAMLDGLHRANALIDQVAPHSPWYRCHRLLRGHLRAELARHHPGAVAPLQLRAAEWFAENHRPLKALEHAVAAGDVSCVAALLERHAVALVSSGHGAAVRSVLDALPATAARADPRLALVSAYASLEAGDAESCDHHLTHCADFGPLLPGPDALPGPDGPPRALGIAVRLARARLRGDPSKALTAADGLPDPAGEQPDVTAVMLAGRGSARLEAGRRSEGRADLEKALAIARRNGLDGLVLACLSGLATVATAECDFTRADSIGRSAVDFAASRGWGGTSGCAPAYTAQAWAACQALDVEGAGRLSELALNTAPPPAGPGDLFWARTVHAVSLFDRGERREGLDLALRAKRSREAFPVAPELRALAAAAELELALALVHHVRAAEALDAARPHLGDLAEVTVMEARLLAARHCAEAARHALRPVLLGTAAALLTTTLVEAWLLEAHLAASHGAEPRAEQALREALAAAAPARALRPFHTAGPRMRALMTGVLPRLGDQEPFARDVLRALEPVRGADLADPLTPREADLLRLLPSLQTLDEIACETFISVNTLKTHLRSIYRKLGVSCRRQAVAAGLDQGLL
jgi:LuxR family maltose regulon positive regulatory protein